MSNPIATRLAKLEAKNPPPAKCRRFVRAVGDDRDHDSLYRLLEAEGYAIGPDSADRFIIRWIVNSASQANTDRVQPYITHGGAGSVRIPPIPSKDGYGQTVTLQSKTDPSRT